MKYRKIRERAAQLLERDGWCQGTKKDAQGRRCLSGALEAVAEWEEAGDVWYALRMELNAVPSAWNDAPGRTLAEVLAALRGDAHGS